MENYFVCRGKKYELTEVQADGLVKRITPAQIQLEEAALGMPVTIGWYEFVVLEQFEDSAAVILKDLLDKDILFGKNNCYDGSDADKACKAFAEEIAGIVGAEKLVAHTVDLTSDDGLKDYGSIQRRASLLTADLYRKYVEILDLHKVDRWWWLATPHSTKRHENDLWVKCVSPSGFLLDFNYDDDGNGVRPFCILKSDIFVSK